MAVSSDALFGKRPDRIRRDPTTAVVVRVDDSGRWASPIGDDSRHPIGPCRGPAVAVGDTVLLVWTDERPWIATIDQPA